MNIFNYPDSFFMTVLSDVDVWFFFIFPTYYFYASWNSFFSVLSIWTVLSVFSFFGNFAIKSRNFPQPNLGWVWNIIWSSYPKSGLEGFANYSIWLTTSLLIADYVKLLSEFLEQTGTGVLLIYWLRSYWFRCFWALFLIFYFAPRDNYQDKEL